MKVLGDNGTVLSLPTTKDKVRLIMQQNPSLFNMSLVSDLYDRYFEVTLGYWLTKGNTSFDSEDYYTFGRLLGGELDPTDSTGNPNYQGNAQHSPHSPHSRGPGSSLSPSTWHYTILVST